MSEVQFLKNLLERDWAETLSGRSTDVPQPAFTLEKKKREARLRTQDVGYVVSGADTVATPQGPSWNERHKATAVTVEYRAAKRTVATGHADPYERLFGQRQNNGIDAPERYDGIVGETKRILEDARRRTAEFDRVGTDRDASPIRVVRPDRPGVNYYQANVVVPMDQFVLSIDTST